MGGTALPVTGGIVPRITVPEHSSIPKIVETPVAAEKATITTVVEIPVKA